MNDFTFTDKGLADYVYWQCVVLSHNKYLFDSRHMAAYTICERKCFL